MSFDTVYWRKRLGAYNDPGFEAFCQDYFQTVHERFARGLLLDEKVSLLLDHCVRNPGEAELLKQILASKQRITIISERVQPYNFDMIPLVNRAMRKLHEYPKGLVGLAVACHDPIFFEHFCERLQIELGRNLVKKLDTLPIKPRDIAIAEAMDFFKSAYIPAVRRKDVLFYLQIVDSPYILSFWERINEVVAGIEIPNRLIVVLPIEPEYSQALPNTLYDLRKPIFTWADASMWVHSICDYFGFSNELYQCWISLIYDECKRLGEEDDEMPLDIHRTYMHMKDMLSFLADGPTPEEVQQELQIRRIDYVDTEN